VVVNGREAAPAQEAANAIAELGGEAVACAGSVADFDFAEQLVETCAERFGSIDVLVNCAGISEPPGASILDMSARDWRESIDAHLTSTFNCCRHAGPRMVAQQRGAIVNTSSHAFLGDYGGTAYPAAKGGTNSLTFALAAELREHGVRVNAICPGASTRLSTGAAFEQHIRELHARGLLDDVTRDAALAPPAPEHVGPLYAFLASDLAEGISGRVFSAVGGYVGVFAPSEEKLLAFRDHRSAGPWPIEDLANAVRESEVL
jgi:NAD(P)-dependent dehydrogenase (short-subunit alcohol dehydrogenase family)